MIRIALLAMVCLILSGQPSSAADVGRYQITPGSPVILLDTATGKTWHLQDGQWLPMNIVRPQPVPPKPKETTRQRWQRESDTRRLQLDKSGPKPVQKPPIRSLLEKLAPSK